jgi:hypothetical protein
VVYTKTLPHILLALFNLVSVEILSGLLVKDQTVSSSRVELLWVGDRRSSVKVRLLSTKVALGTARTRRSSSHGSCSESGSSGTRVTVLASGRRRVGGIVAAASARGADTGAVLGAGVDALGVDTRLGGRETSGASSGSTSQCTGTEVLAEGPDTRSGSLRVA